MTPMANKMDPREAQAYGKSHRKKPPLLIIIIMVRVKTGGKSTR